MMLRSRGRAAPRMPAGRAAAGWRIMAGLTAAPVVVVSCFRAVPREWPTTVVQLVSFTPWLVLPAGASLLFAVLGRRRWMAGAAAGLVAVQLFWLVPLDYARAAPDAAHDTVELRTMSLNAKLGQADAAEIVRLVRENGITVLTIQEYTKALEDRLAAAGLATLLPNRISAPAGGAAGNAVYSVHGLAATGKVPGSHFPMPLIRVTAESRGQRAVVELTNVHTRAPVGVGLPKWRSDLAALGQLVSRPGNLVLAGDFNASYDHAEFRRLLQSGGRVMVDVGMLQGSRLVPTWPMEDHALPGITIDHLVASPSVLSANYAVHRVPGTDHAAIMATLSVPATG
ncbi:endonuclease/exonuclease/phosphatase family protein [Arthrobacter sp. PsM3]|uniref:endonuclease/exonuclease/phosphatase family protein n=1 Tax=Arthrobacter sp. PsM3 TaxID=3030531 RepID=UPI00263B0400|nr:endonuclease/exonuclease/phosphatase family protein [Arthrobacter sp. PsM3]MDN4645409.1 endonuclease/exonuclease/phosphatase family protein [Arthrobacter sp. PsM3]